jgi:subtilisin family serine protease
VPTRYLVIRNEGPVLGTVLGGALGGAGPVADQVSIDVVDGHETDAGQLRADPNNMAVMDADIAFKLIEPRATANSASGPIDNVGGIRMPVGVLAVRAHNTPFTGQGVTVAVLDTGIDDQHPAFAGKTLVKRNFSADSGGDPQNVGDSHGHGTHCAATICGDIVGDLRVGVAPGVKTLCVGKVLGQQGCTLEVLLKGMLWAVLDQKASVVSMSLGYDLAGNSQRLIAKGVNPAIATQAAMRQQSDIMKGISTLRTFLESQSPNVVFVAATGNESSRPQFVLDADLPAAELFSVGAVGRQGNAWDIASFSNGRADIVAPGVDVVSAAPGGGWATMSGTSMATPHAAGVAALWTEKLRNAGSLAVPEAVRAAMKANATMAPLAIQDVGAIGCGMAQAPQT